MREFLKELKEKQNALEEKKRVLEKEVEDLQGQTEREGKMRTDWLDEIQAKIDAKQAEFTKVTSDV